MAGRGPGTRMRMRMRDKEQGLQEEPRGKRGKTAADPTRPTEGAYIDGGVYRTDTTRADGTMAAMAHVRMNGDVRYI